MKRIDLLRKQQVLLKKDISAMFDSFLRLGPWGKSPSLSGIILTTKIEGKTVRLYVRKDIAPVVGEMSERYKKLCTLIQKLSKINWEIWIYGGVMPVFEPAAPCVNSKRPKSREYSEALVFKRACFRKKVCPHFPDIRAAQ